MRVLILGLDWHGDVAWELRDGFRALGAEASVRHVLNQRRRGVAARVEDELLARPPLARAIRRRQAGRIVAATRRAVAEVDPTLTVCLAPELMPEAALDALAAAPVTCWWFGDDPFASERRGLDRAPPVLERIGRGEGRPFVAHPDWARGPLRSARYLPYGSRFATGRPAYESPGGRRVGCVVVGSARPERARLLAAVAEALGPALRVWGWGPRGRLPTNAATRSFRRRLRGWRVLSPLATEAVYRSARVVLNLQDPQMLGAWNPQTFDLMGLGVPQVVWNREPVDYIEHPPPHASSAEDLVRAVRERLAGDQERPEVVAGAEEARRRHRWSDRAAAIIDGERERRPRSSPPAHRD